MSSRHQYLIFFILTVSLIKPVTNIRGQGSVTDSLITEGKYRHAMELYSDAIILFKKALEINPGCSRASCELAYTYFTVKDYDKAISFARQSLASDNNQLPEAWLIWASALEESEKQKKALKIYEKGLTQFPEDHLLAYNKGVLLFRMNRIPEAKESLMGAVQRKPSHAGSHLMLAYTEISAGESLQAMLSLYTFLLLEPRSDRTLNAWERLVSLQNEQRRKQKSMPAAFTTKEDSSLQSIASEIFYSWDALLKKTPQDTSVLAQFATRSRLLFSLLPPGYEYVTTLFSTLYLPFYHSLFLSGNADAYSYYISQGIYDNESRDWFANHPHETELFTRWIEKQEYLK